MPVLVRWRGNNLSDGRITNDPLGTGDFPMFSEILSGLGANPDENDVRVREITNLPNPPAIRFAPFGTSQCYLGYTLGASRPEWSIRYRFLIASSTHGLAWGGTAHMRYLVGRLNDVSMWALDLRVQEEGGLGNFRRRLGINQYSGNAASILSGTLSPILSVNQPYLIDLRGNATSIGYRLFAEGNPTPLFETDISFTEAEIDQIRFGQSHTSHYHSIAHIDDVFVTTDYQWIGFEDPVVDWDVGDDESLVEAFVKQSGVWVPCDYEAVKHDGVWDNTPVEEVWVHPGFAAEEYLDLDYKVGT